MREAEEGEEETIGPFIREKISLTLAAAYIIHERNYLYEYKLQGQDKPQLEKAVNVDFVPFIRGSRVLCKLRVIFSRINGPNFNENQRFLFLIGPFIRGNISRGLH